MNYASGELSPGLKIMIDKEPYVILEHEFVNPGKGQAFMRIKIRNLTTDRVLQRTLKSGESVAAADIQEVNMQFLFSDNNGMSFHFMDQSSFEQHEVNKTVVKNSLQWMKEGDICSVVLHNGLIIAITLPNHVELEITEAEPGIKGDTAQGATKQVIVSTGGSVRVPLFVNQGDTIRVDTRTGEYLGRSK